MTTGESAWPEVSWKRRAESTVALGAIVFFSLCAILPLLWIFGYLISRGLPSLNSSFFIETPRPMGVEGGGMNNAVVGSAVLVALASLMGIPVGMGAGVLLAEYKTFRLARTLHFTVDLLTSVPSIIIGLFAYSLLVAPMQGYSAWAGSLALSMLIIPVVARTTQEILSLVPQHVREAGLALGIPRWKVILSIVIPGARGGLVTGIIIALARAAGETAPLLFTSASNQFGFRGLNQPTASLPVQIFNYATSHDEVWRSQAWTGALVLVSCVLILNLATRLFLRSSQSMR